MSADQTKAGGHGARSMERHLGNAIRSHRFKNHLTIGEVATQAGISQGMLSKIENGQAAMSLDTLERVARAFGVPVGDFFRAYDLPAGGARLVRSDEGMEVVRGGTQRGYTYNLLAYDKGPRRSFEPFLVTMNDETEVFPSFEHPGTEFIHLLQGRIEYRHGRHTYLMEPGDSLTFRGDIPHGPERLLEVPIRLLSMIVYGAGELE
jgi:transcriptional regulator with XRE-family HTH domain